MTLFDLQGWRIRPAVFWRDVCAPVCPSVQATPSPGPQRLVKTALRATLSPKGEKEKALTHARFSLCTGTNRGPQNRRTALLHANYV